MAIHETCAMTKNEVALIVAGESNSQFTFVRVGDFVDLKTEKHRLVYQELLGTGPYQIVEIKKLKGVGRLLFVQGLGIQKGAINPTQAYHVAGNMMTRPLTYEEMVLYFENRPEFLELRSSREKIQNIILEFDELLQSSTYLETETGKVCSCFFDESIVQGVIHVRTFLACYIGAPTQLPILASQN